MARCSCERPRRPCSRLPRAVVRTASLLSSGLMACSPRPALTARPQGAGRINTTAPLGSRCWDRQHPAHWHRPAPRRSLPAPAQSAAFGGSAVDAARCASGARCSAADCGPPVAPSAPVSPAAALPAASPRSMPRRPRTDRAVSVFRFASSVCGDAAGRTVRCQSG